MSDEMYMRASNGRVFTTSNPEYHKECERLTHAQGKLEIKEYAKSELRELIAPGSTVHCVLRSVSSSGMSRRISLFIVCNGDLKCIDYLASCATGFKHSDKSGLIVAGCGMDMGFHLVYSLGYTLWPTGTDKPHGTHNGKPDRDGGYALKHNWI